MHPQTIVSLSFLLFPTDKKVLEYSDQIRLDESCFCCQLNIHMLLPNNVSRQVLHLFGPLLPDRFLLNVADVKADAIFVEGRSSSPLKKNRHALPLQQLSPYRRRLMVRCWNSQTGTSLLTVVHRQRDQVSFISTRWWGKRYDAIVFRLSFIFVWTKKVVALKSQCRQEEQSKCSAKTS